MVEQHVGELTVQLTPRIVKVTAEVELLADGKCVGTTTVDLTPEAPTTGTVLDGVGRVEPDVEIPTLVVAQTEYRAAVIAKKMGIARPIVSNPRTAAEAVRGLHLQDIVIDDECKGISNDTMSALREGLVTPGLIMRYVERSGA